MDINTEIATIVRQEEALWFPTFMEADAWRLGLALQETAKRDHLPIAIDISRLDRQLFFVAMPGASYDNQDWCRRKRNVVLRFGHSSYFIEQKMKAVDTTLAAGFSLAGSDYAAGGGAFPICVQGCGMVACVSVSGLDSRADHSLIVEAMCGVLGLDATAFRLEK